MGLGQRKKAGYWHREISLQDPKAGAKARLASQGLLEGQDSSWQYFAGHILATRPPKSMDISSFTACEPDSERTEQFMLHFSTWMHREYLRCSPRTENLLSLIQFNMTRSLVANAKILGFTTRLMARQARSPLASTGVDSKFIDSLPPSLQPTIFQLTIPHHPWIDLLPVPELRNNLLSQDPKTYDAVQLCRDMRGFQQVTDGKGGVAIWGQPWDPQCWEVSPAFAQKWPWVVQGCQGLLASTNHWRAIRDEQPLDLWRDNSLGQGDLCRAEEP
jgi:hypothetical protein